MLKKLFKTPYFVMGFIGVLVVLIIITLNGTHEVSEYVEKNYGITIDMDSNGNENIYVKDGVIVSFQNVYHNDNYIALKVEVKNNDRFEPLQITASIKGLEQEISFTVVEEDYGYLMIGDSQASTYDVDVLIEQKGLPLASGVVHITHNKENASVLTSNDILTFSEKLKVLYLGKDADAHFFSITNDYKKAKNIAFNGGSSSFHVNVDVGKNQYIYVKGLGDTNISIQSFNIEVRDVIVEPDLSEEALYAN